MTKLDELTIGEAKQLAQLFAIKEQEQSLNKNGW